MLFCAAGAREADAISVTNSVKDSAGNPVSGAHIEMVGNSSVYADSGSTGSFIIDGLPSGSAFSLKISKSGFMPVYTANMNSTQNIVPPVQWNYVLHTSSEVSSIGVTSGKGVIASRVSDNANPSVNIGGAAVSCTSTKHPGACPYTIKYNDGTNVVEGSSTYGNGKYYVLNVDDNDTVTVTATKSGWNFPIKPFITHADAVSEGRINGILAPNNSVSGNVIYKGSRPGTLYVGLFNSPVVTPEGLAYATEINNPGVYTAFTISGVPDGTYYVGAIKTNSTDMIQREDPYGMYGAPTPVVVSGGIPVTGINFTIVDGTALHPNPFYFSWDTLDISCPASVNVGSPLTVTVALYNWDCDNSLNVARFMMSVVGNADGTLSGLGIFGPYNRSLSTPKVVPPASCGATTTPGTVTPFNLTAMNTVPASLSGKMALVMIDAMSATGQSISGKECMVQVP